MNVLARNLVEKIADDLGVIPGFIEKDWHIGRALVSLVSLGSNAKPVIYNGHIDSEGPGRQIRNPFDKGIWDISRANDQLTRFL